MQRFRPRATYANVMVTIAVFLALGGGAYALSGVPDGNGIFHGCVSKKTGVLRVVNSATSCQKARGRGKHRNPGEFAVVWNQKGQPGLNGTNGTNGINGKDGTNGTNGTDGTARAYGRVNRFTAGFLDPNSKNVVGVSNSTGGVYCVELAPSIDASKAFLLTTPDYQHSDSFSGAIATYVYPGGCSPTTAPNSLMVVTGYYGISGGLPAFTETNESFNFAVP